MEINLYHLMVHPWLQICTLARTPVESIFMQLIQNSAVFQMWQTHSADDGLNVQLMV